MSIVVMKRCGTSGWSFACKFQRSNVKDKVLATLANGGAILQYSRAPIWGGGAQSLPGNTNR